MYRFQIIEKQTTGVLMDVNLDPFNLEIDYKIWFEKVTNAGSQSLIGEKKIELLQAIHKLGSIKAAAEACKIDFKVAWDMIASANQRFEPHDLVVSTRGRGGGSYLSPLGLEILQRYESMNKVIKQILPKILDGHFADISEVNGVNKNCVKLDLRFHSDDPNQQLDLDKIFQLGKTVFVIPYDSKEE